MVLGVLLRHGFIKLMSRVLAAWSLGAGCLFGSKGPGAAIQMPQGLHGQSNGPGQGRRVRYPNANETDGDATMQPNGQSQRKSCWLHKLPRNEEAALSKVARHDLVPVSCLDICRESVGIPDDFGNMCLRLWRGGYAVLN